MMGTLKGDSIFVDKDEGDGLRKSGIDVVGDVPWGTHLCQFYEDKRDLIEVLVPYFAEGLRNNEFCMWVTSPPLGVDEARIALRKVVPNLEEYEKKGQIEIILYKDWYLLGGEFDADRVLSGWVEKEKKALAQGFAGLRLTGNTFWITRKLWNQFVDYEATVNDVLGKYRILAICIYSLEKCNGGDVVDIMRNHQSILIRKKGNYVQVEDVLKRRKVEEEVVSLSRFPLESPSPLLRIAADGTVLVTNFASKSLLGKWKSGIGQPVPEDWRQLVADVLNSGQRKDVEIKDGNKIVSFMLIPIKDKDYVNVYGRDITAYKQLEKTLQESEEKYRQLVENAQEGIWAIDSEARTSFVNKRMAEMLGYTVDEILGKSLFSFMNERGIRLAKELFERHKRGILGQHDFEFFRKDGTRMYASSETSPLTDENGNFIGALACVADITERKRMEVEIQNYSKHLEELVETRTKTLNEIHERLLVAERLVAIGEMAGMVGHDLRNPLQVMVNTIYRAEKNVKSLSVKDRKIVERIGLLEFRKTLTEQVEYMNSIISNLQEYAKVLKPKLVETDLYHLIDNVLSTVTVPENIAVSILIEDDFPLLMLDSLMMRRVFTNLVSNAVQAMPEGGKLTIKASKTEEDVLISFEDTGVGIPQENLSKLFKLLFTTKAKGQGFGLAVCKRLVEAHEGSITVESMVGKGSVFTIRMPIRMEVSKNG